MAAEPLGPGRGPWATGLPEHAGLDPELLEAARDYIDRKLPTTVEGLPKRDCFLVAKDGVIVYEWYHSDLFNKIADHGQSMTKTVGALIAGWAVTQGMLDLDADITRVYGVPSPKPYGVTSRQIMSQAVADDSQPNRGWDYDMGGNRWIDTMIPVVYQATGRRPSQIWYEEFQQQLGLEHFDWNGFRWVDRKVTDGDGADRTWAWGTRGTCRDYARLVQLLLNRGRWRGIEKPLISAEYVRQMTTPQSWYAPFMNYSNRCYGLLTWLHTDPKEFPGPCLIPPHALPSASQLYPKGAPGDIFMAQGMGGKIAMGVPKHNAVLISLGDHEDPSTVAPVVYEGMCKVFGDCE
jgi:CubicO group peptidase (beta-lactamase class C family)